MQACRFLTTVSMAGPSERCAVHYNKRAVIAPLLTAILILSEITYAQVAINSVTLSPPPGIFNGTNTKPSSSPCVVHYVFNGQLIVCSGTSVLNDGDLGPLNGLSVNKVYAWDSTFDIVLGTRDMVLITQVRLSFYNQPSIGVGLPSIDRLYWGTNANSQTNVLGFTIAGNQNLTQQDSGRRSVSLIITSIANVQYIRIQFSFPPTLVVTTALLSEIELFTTPAPQSPQGTIAFVSQPAQIYFDPESPVSTYNISCTVSNEGYFEWNWVLPPGIKSQRWIADGTRTTILQLSNISSDYSGNYTCQAKATSQSTTYTNFTMTLEFPTIVVATTQQVMSNLYEEASFTCEIYGYSSSMAHILWRVPSSTIPVTEGTLPFTIRSNEGGRSLQIGQQSLKKSLRYSLYFTVQTIKYYGVYTCMFGHNSSSTLLTMMLPPESSAESSGIITAPPRATPTPAAAGPMTTVSYPSVPMATKSSTAVAIVAGVVAPVIILILIIAGLIMVVRVRKWTGQQDTMTTVPSHATEKEYTSTEPIYSDVAKPEPPPYPSHFFNTYAHVDADIAQKQSSGRSTVGDKDRFQKLTIQMSSLLPNPMYSSSDDLLSSPHQTSVNDPHLSDTPDAPPGGFVLDIYAKPSCVRLPESRGSSLSPLPPLPPPYNPIYSEALLPDMFSAMASDEECLQPCNPIYADPSPLTIQEAPLIIGQEHLREVGFLGTGQFGQVILAETVNLSLKDLKMSDCNETRGMSVLVAVKKLKEDADQSIKEAFEKEIKYMSRLNHKNVVRILGICISRNPFIAMEYMENGDLNQYLQGHELATPAPSQDHPTLPLSTLIFIALQVARAMDYLSSLQFIHRDLATRNCLVGSNNTVKIADFGMSRSLYSSDYYRLRGRAMLPIRWMARECFYGRFSEKTDVWAFGITMWEIVTLAKDQPYSAMTDQEVIDNAIKESGRYLLEMPSYCPFEIYNIMLRCWVDDPNSRATFKELEGSIASLQ